ncbi:uncharacterized protein BDW47DRAFT_101428 [Aspergillus candidus]|uniref:Uncharacterized protein n=1 Tax=Aspergillus candidus TaxID=41067 RepID=A0A2I2FJ15_ASPCN|nr:hypothetical protein BDW47DRAFT_101428 [Aspergillus candidus]PLB40617.1 hypothetical protein BDW47DRAFT_101428 [Aspergillus candidus]
MEEGGVTTGEVSPSWRDLLFHSEIPPISTPRDRAFHGCRSRVAPRAQPGRPTSPYYPSLVGG